MLFVFLTYHFLIRKIKENILFLVLLTTTFGQGVTPFSPISKTSFVCSMASRDFDNDKKICVELF